MTDTAVQKLIINRLTKTRYNGLSPSNDELWAVDPEFSGSKALATDNNGDIVETSVTSTELGYLSGTTSAVQTQLNGKASTSLDNLSADGQMIIDSQNGTISNCVLEIPQDIKLELDNGTLTLKAGSKVYVPNGVGVFNTITIENDITVTTAGGANADITAMLIYDTTTNSVRANVEITRCLSGTTEPSGTDCWFYNTSTNKIGYWTHSTSTYARNPSSFPLAIVKRSADKKITSIDQVFNGVGYIGQQAFVTPGVKALIPDGYNSDGSLKSMLASTNKLSVLDMGTDHNERYIILGNQVGQIRPNDVTTQYAVREDNASDPYGFTFKDNKYIGIGSSILNTQLYFVKLAITEREQTSPYTVTNLIVRQPVRLATTEMTDNLQSQVSDNATAIATKQDTLVSGTNIKTINSTTVLGSGNFTLADQNLSNLNSTGQMIVDSQNGTISNCILEISQDIKLEVASDGVTVTLKSGSTYYTPNGAGVFDKTTTASDITATNPLPSYSSLLLGLSGGTLRFRPFANSESGAGATTISGFAYDTTANKIRYYNSQGSVTYDNCSLPIAKLIVNTGIGKITDIEVFNGFGYIGSTSYYLPGIKMLVPNGKNADGTLKSTLFTTTSVAITASTYTSPYIVSIANSKLTPAYYTQYAEQDEQPSFTNGVWYNPKENNQYQIASNVATLLNQDIHVFDQTVSDGKITSLTVRRPVRTVTTEMFDTELSKKQDVLTFDTTPIQNSTNPVTSGGIYNKIFSNDVVHKDTVSQTAGYNILTQPLNSMHRLEGTGVTNSPQGDSTVYNAGLSVKLGNDDNLEAWFKGFYLYGQWNNSNNLWYGTRAAGTSETPATTINWHPVVMADKGNTFTNTNTFTGIQNIRKTGYARADLLRLYDDGQEKGTNPTSAQGAVINWSDKNGAALGLIENRYETNGRRYLHFNTRNGDCTANKSLDFGWVSSNNGYKLTIGTNESINYSLNEITTSTTDCDVPTKGYINQKFTVVSTVPVSPTTGVYYFVTTGQIYYGSTLVMDANLTNYTGYDATKTQTLKNVNGTLTWVDD